MPAMRAKVMTTDVMKKKKVAVGMSGGVDSSVSALLLKQQGYDVVGLFMKLWHDPCGTGQNACCDEKALADAQKVAKEIGIPLYVVDVRREFKEAVTDYFIDEYSNCRTPNPCVVCNKKIKFGWLLDFAKKIGCDYLATGHYARVSKSVNQRVSNSVQELTNRPADSLFYSLEKGKDLAKDQSYFLYRLSQDQLSRIIFPVGGMTKDEVRKIAKENDLPVHEKKESQEICFVEDDYRSFLKRNLGENAFQAGEIVDSEGNIIGRHEGLINYTIGQRKGIDQVASSKGQVARKPLYVIGFNREKNQLVVGEDKDLLKKEFVVESVSWINPSSEGQVASSKGLKVKIRYKADEVPCSVTMIRDSRFMIQTAKPVRAVTPGQSAVFYSGDEVIGGGVIS